MNPGVLDKRVIIQQKVLGQDGSGQPVETWSDVVTVWAQEKFLRGDERFQSRQIVGKSMMTLKIRYRSGISTLNRVSYDGKFWDISDVRRLGRKDMIELDISTRSE